MLDLNITMLFQFINFIIALVVLNYLLIKPVREIIKKRNGIMDGLANEADGFHKEAVNKLEAYEAELAKARHQAGLNREQGRNEGLAELQAIIGGAQQSARELLEENRAALHSQAEVALSALRDGIDDFSTRLGQKIMGK